MPGSKRISAVLAELKLVEQIAQADLEFVSGLLNSRHVGIGSLTFDEVLQIELLAAEHLGHQTESRLTREDAEALARVVKQSNELAKSASRSFLPKELPCP